MIKQERRVVSMSKRILWLAQGEERNVWVILEVPQEAFGRINESCAGIRRRSAARFNSNNLFCRVTSMAKPIENGAPNKQ